MKTTEKLPTADGRVARSAPVPGRCNVASHESMNQPAASAPPAAQSSIVNRKSQIGNRPGFTLIELLTVIAIMGIIAAMIFPVLGSVKRHQYVNAASAELNQIVGALADYHAKYNTYPPSNPALSPAINTLYYELSGVTLDSTGTLYTTLDGACSVPQGNYANMFKTTAPVGSIDGIVNCTKGGEEGAAARNFLPSLKANRIGTSIPNGIQMTNIVTSVRGPDAAYMPLGPGAPDVNPFCYSFPGTNNPTSYDLWIDLRISGKTNRICNWRSTPFTL